MRRSRTHSGPTEPEDETMGTVPECERATVGGWGSWAQQPAGPWNLCFWGVRSEVRGSEVKAQKKALMPEGWKEEPPAPAIAHAVPGA